MTTNCIFATILIFTFIRIFEAQNSYVYPCYFCNYQSVSGNYTPEQYIPGLCTHIYYAFGVFNESTFEASSSDPATDYSENNGLGFYERVNNLKKLDSTLQATLLSFGGWGFSTQGSLPFSKMTNNSANRQIFISSAIQLIRKNEFDGIDIDWEFPDGDSEKDNYISFLKELYEATVNESKISGKTKLLITAAVAQGYHNIANGYKISEMVPYVDYVGVMTYDFHNGCCQNYTDFNSPLFMKKNGWANDTYENIAAAAQHWTSGGMPKNKTLIGFPTYGHGWTLLNKDIPGVYAPAVGPSKAGFGTAYYDFCRMVNNHTAIRTFDSEAKVPYLVEGDQWFSYDDVESYKIKLEWVKNQSYGGAFIWSLDTDDWRGLCNSSMKYPLQSTIAFELGGIDVNKESSSSKIIMLNSIVVFVLMYMVLN